MALRYSGLSVLFIALSILPANAQNSYQTIFGNDYADALSYMRTNRLTHIAVCKHNAVPIETIIPAIFPERIRYSIVRDYLETETMKFFYINNGSEFADFSIGDFQLKASFAEDIEQYIKKYPNLEEKYNLLIINNINNKETRKTRMKRLQNTAYQLFYICAFYDIIDIRFGLHQLSADEQVRFTASAYNHGFTKSKESIERYSKLHFFPYGAGYPGEQYAYSDVALDFYHKHFQAIYNNRTEH